MTVLSVLFKDWKRVCPYKRAEIRKEANRAGLTTGIIVGVFGGAAVGVNSNNPVTGIVTGICLGIASGLGAAFFKARDQYINWTVKSNSQEIAESYFRSNNNLTATEKLPRLYR